MEKSISVKQDYVMVIHNPVEDTYDYIIYHVLDFSRIEGNTHVNIQNKNKQGEINRFSLTDVRFYDLLSSGILTRLRI
jgi:hypothetical protein